MNIVLSILVLASVGFFLGAILIWQKGGPKKQALLLLLLAVIAAVNVAIWTIPGKDGASPLDHLDNEEAPEGG